MKKVLTILTTLLLSLSLVACSSSDETKPQDKNFVKDVGKSFEARSKYIDEVNSGKIVVDENEYLKEAVLKEKNILEKYKDAEFDSPELSKLAEDYLNALDKQENSLKYYSNDYIKYEKNWTEGYNERSTILTTLVDKFGVKLDEKAFNELKQNAQVVKENNEIKEKIDAITKSIKFEKVKDEYGWKDYEAIVENNSGVDLESYYLDVKLIDKDGVVVESTPVSTSGLWKNGQKVKLEFSTDNNFDKLEWDAEYYIKE